MDRPRPVLCACFPFPRSPSGRWSRGRSRGRSTQLTITPQVRRQMLRHTQGGAPLTACYSPSRDRVGERTRRPTPARPPNQQIDLLRRRGPNPRSCVRLRRRGGVTTRGARLLGRLVSAEWIVPLRHWRAAALCTTGLFALRDWLMIHGSDPRHRPIRDCPRPPQDEGFLRQTVEMISVSRSEEDRFARPMGFPPTSRAR